MAKPRPYEETHSEITCVECGTKRMVRNQDKHQVVRCVDCQRAYRIARRNELRQLEIGDR